MSTLLEELPHTSAVSTLLPIEAAHLLPFLLALIKFLSWIPMVVYLWYVLLLPSRVMVFMVFNINMNI